MISISEVTFLSYRSIPHPLLQYEGAEVCLIVKDYKGGTPWNPTIAHFL